jgi:hypothetical protein
MHTRLRLAAWPQARGLRRPDKLAARRYVPPCVADFSHVAVKHSGIPDKSNSLCPGYVMSATLKK